MNRGRSLHMTRWRARRRLQVLRVAGAPARPSPVLRRPRLAGLILAGLLGAGAAALSGPVAGVLAAAYGLVALTGVLRRRAGAVEERARVNALDAVARLAADLRAGVDASAAWTTSREPVEAVPAVRHRVSAAWTVADATGAALADLLDRLQTELRDLQRVRLLATARASGIHATAVLLAALPVAGIGLGYGMGGNPVTVLLHTPLGAGCAVTGVVLQVAGFGWTARLARVPW